MRIHRTSVALGATGLVAGLALGITGFAHAADPTPSSSQGTRQERPGFDHHGVRSHGFHGYGGLVTAVGADSLTVRTPRGVETIGLTSGTVFYRGDTKVDRAAVQPGEVVRVRLADPKAASKVASVVVVVPAHLTGWVTKLDSTSLTITDLDGFTRTIRTTSSTAYLKDGATATRDAVAVVGTLVHAVGTVDSDGTTLDATRVSVGAPDGQRRPMGEPMGAPAA